MKKNKQTSDQTKFVQENLLYEQEEKRWWQEGKSRIKPEYKFLQTSKGKIVAAAIFMLVVASVGVLFLSFFRKDSPSPNGSQVVVSEQKRKELTDLQSQIIDLREQLQESDPAKQEIPFPQVDMNIRVVEVED